MGKSSMKVLHQIVSHNASSGQAILELLISFAVLILVAMALLSAVNGSLGSLVMSRTKSQSVYYAQEGIERAREQRNLSWAGLVTNCCGSNGGVIAGTRYRRSITVNSLNPNVKEVTVTVTWTIEGRNYQTPLKTVFTNW